MNILWLTWRDIKNPDAGGAEKVAIETASRLVKDQIPVTLFSSHFANAKNQENVRGVKIVRRGGLITCRLFAFLYYIKRTDEFDLIIDEINTIPFFSIFYAKKKTVVLIHQLAKEYWFTQTIWPINQLGYQLQPFWLKLYKKRPTLALSSSTKVDLIKLGFTNVIKYNIGLDFKPRSITKKNNHIVFLGRLVRAKGVEDAIRAFKIIHNKLPAYKLIIVGQGDARYINELKKITRILGLEKVVQFTGYVSDEEKIAVLQKSKVTLIPSTREGWAIVATEANALCSIPIAYNVPGLKDAIKNGQNGFLVKNNPQELAKFALKVITNERLRSKLADNGYKLSTNYSWEKTYLIIKKIIQQYS